MENKSVHNKIEIQPKGSYYPIDEDGYLINPASIDKVSEKWKPLILEIVEVYKNHYGEKLKNIYVRGSVVRGEAVEGISDIDTFAYVDASREELQKQTISTESIKQLRERYDFVEDVEMNAKPLSNITQDYIILNQSLCFYGEPVPIPKLKVGKGLAIHSPHFYKDFRWFEKFLEKNTQEDERKRECSWLMKRLLRTGFELTMERSKKYTRDLYRCYETFSEYYPSKESEMREALDLALNPTADTSKMKEVLDNLGAWLVKEIPQHFNVKQ